MSAAVRRIDDDVLAILSAGVCEGPRYYLPKRELPRKDYERVNKVLDALGGKWSRHAKAHVFSDVCEPMLESAIENGTFTRPADMGWFPTPDALVVRMLGEAAHLFGARVLEPSAGEGSIALAALKAGAIVDCYEIDAKRSARLAQLCAGVGAGRTHWSAICADFLTIPPAPMYDAVLMNPPFAKRADIAHVLHARKFLKPEGRLVAIMSGGIMFREDRLTREFLEQCSTVEALPAGSFHASGTEVNTALITMGAAQ